MRTILTTIAALTLTTGMASAQATGIGVGNATSGSTSQSGSIAQNALVLESAEEQTIRNTPSVSAPGFSSGHPCGLAWSAGVAVLGTGLTGGNTRSDDACLLAQMGETQAAIYMIAARNRAACRALEAAGRVTCADGGSTASASTTASSRAATATTQVAFNVECVTGANGNIQARATQAVFDAYGQAAVVNACR